MAHRHQVQAKARGGGVAPKGGQVPSVAYAGGGSKVASEARKHKSGGRVKGMKTGGRLDRRMRGGGIKASGKDATKSPWSAAHTGK